MFGTASRGKHDLVLSLGGIPIDYKSDDFVGRVLQMTGSAGVDAVFDAVEAAIGGALTKVCTRVAKRRVES